MKHLFVSYEIAKMLKEKGFNEPCLTSYNNECNLCSVWNLSDEDIEEEELMEDTQESLYCKNSTNENDYITAPLYQQVVDWFREKHGLSIWVEPATLSYRYYILSDDNKWEGFKEPKGYYEALTKAIEEAIKLI